MSEESVSLEISQFERNLDRQGLSVQKKSVYYYINTIFQLFVLFSLSFHTECY